MSGDYKKVDKSCKSYLDSLVRKGLLLTPGSIKVSPIILEKYGFDPQEVPMFYQYWDNSEKYHGKLIFEGNFSSISEADKVFEHKFSIKLVQNSQISVQIHKNVFKNNK